MTVELETTLEVVATLREPVTARDIADHLECTRRTAYNRLMTLADQGFLATKKVGARGRIWWRPADEPGGVSPSGPPDPTEEQRVRPLRELHDASRELMRAETHEAVYRVGVDAAQRILGLALNGLWVEAPDRPVLEPVEWTESGVAEYGKPPAFPLEGSLVGRAYRDGTARVYDDITSEAEVFDPETDVRSELILPLGEHGVLNASSPDPSAFDAVDVSLGRILAANVETALDRADQLEERRARRRELARLNQLNTLIEDIIDALIGMATREEIERTVHERLSGSAFYVDAWIVERDPATDRLRFRQSSPAETDGRGDPIPVPAPIDRAINSQESTAFARNPTDNQLPSTFRSLLATVGARTGYVVPLTHADSGFGALVITAEEAGAFDDREQRALDTLGEVVGFVINATNNRQLLLGNTAIELSVAIPDGAGWLLDASARLSGTLSLQGLVRSDEGTVLGYVSVETTANAPADTLLGLPTVHETRVLASDADTWLLECTIPAADAPLTAITEFGATIRTATASDGEARLTVRFPPSVTAREAMDVVRQSYPSAQFRAKRVVDVSNRMGTTVRQTIDDRLTERQATTLRAAFLAGYYDTPRDTTAEELASSIDIAPSTLYEHLQAAHGTLLETVFDDLGDPRD